MSNNYELFLILKPKNDDAAIQKAIREVEAVLNKYEAKVLKTGKGANAKLAYPIDNRHDSYQTTLEISANPQKIAELRRQLILVPDVMRFSIFTLASV